MSSGSGRESTPQGKRSATSQASSVDVPPLSALTKKQRVEGQGGSASAFDDTAHTRQQPQEQQLEQPVSSIAEASPSMECKKCEGGSDAAATKKDGVDTAAAAFIEAKGIDMNSHKHKQRHTKAHKYTQIHTSIYNTKQTIK